MRYATQLEAREARLSVVPVYQMIGHGYPYQSRTESRLDRLTAYYRRKWQNEARQALASQRAAA